MKKMKAAVFHGVDDVRVEEVPRPRPKPGEAVIRITATTICGTDVHIVKGEYPVRQGLILGHEPVGVIDELGSGLDDEYPSASGSSSARSRRAANASTASMPCTRNATVRSAAGASGTRSTAPGPSTCSSRRARQPRGHS